MAKSSSTTPGTSSRPPLEFWLVVIMLLVLCFLVIIVLFVPTNPFDKVQPETVNFKEALDYRSDLLAVIITAFGAWIGAGAAYFFGRENLRVAADSILAMRDLSPRERLRRTSIKQIPPVPLDWTVKRADTVQTLQNKLQTDVERWFIPVIKSDGSLETVINEEAVWRYTVHRAANPLPAGAADTVDELLKFMEADPKLKRFSEIHVTVTPETSVGAANDLMEAKQVFLAIVITDGKPTHFFTTSEVRKLLLD